MTHSAPNVPMPKTSLDGHLDQSGLPPEDVQTLQMARYVFQSFAYPTSQAWLHAIDLAYTDTDDRDPMSFYRVLSVVQAVRSTRVSVFRFSNPACARCAQRITAHERQFMSCLTAAKHGRMDAAAGHAFLLCEGNDTAMVMAALQQFRHGAATR